VSGTAPSAGASAQFTATAALSDTSSRPVTADATWQSSNTAVATVNAGTVTGVTAGEVDISATYQNVTGKLHVTIAPPAPAGPPTVKAVSVDGTPPAIGVTTQFHAAATLSDNSSREVTNAAIWRSSNTVIATVNAGQVRGVNNGEVDIIATYQGVTGQLHITIGPSAGTSTATVTSITVTGSAPSIGNSSNFRATATLSDQTSKDVTSLASWRSSNTSVANVVNGTVVGGAAGEADISATYQNVTGSVHLVIGSGSSSGSGSGSSAGCVFSVFPATLLIPQGGDRVALTVSASASNCSWTATSSDAFVTIESGASGTGGGLALISVSANTGAARSSVITIAGIRVSVSQPGPQGAANCAVSLLPTGADYSAEYKQGTITVSIAAGCQWTVSSSSPFIVLNNFPGSWTGSSSFVYKVFGNLTGVPRSGSIRVGQQTFNITQRAPLGTNSLSFVSDPGDYVGQGWTVLHEAPTSTFTATLDPSRNHVGFRIVGSDGIGTLDWTLDFAAPQGQQLAVGTYMNATRWPFQAPSVPGIDFSGDGRGCNRENGQFTITDFAYGGDGSLQRLTATFEQHCEGGGPALRGKIVYAR
jgi:hypothetical protein